MTECYPLLAAMAWNEFSTAVVAPPGFFHPSPAAADKELLAKIPSLRGLGSCQTLYGLAFNFLQVLRTVTVMQTSGGFLIDVSVWEIEL